MFIESIIFTPMTTPMFCIHLDFDPYILTLASLGSLRNCALKPLPGTSKVASVKWYAFE